MAEAIGEFPHEPFLVRRLATPNGGVDFLGLRQVNLVLMAKYLPGINNVTRRIRPYSVAAWIYVHAAGELSADGSAIDSERLARFAERFETLFTWGHKRANITDVPGLRARVPAGEVGTDVPLDFASWSRDYRNTGLMSAIQYGPSSKALGFLQPAPEGGFRATGVGVTLAAEIASGFAALVQRDAATAAIAHGFEPCRAPPEVADRLMEVWSADRPTSREQTAFRSVLFDPEKIGTASPTARRSETIAVILEILRQSANDRDRDAVSSEDLRRMAAYSAIAPDHPLALPPALEPALTRWAVLLLRQAQRLALEALQSRLEELILGGRRESRSLAEAMAEDWRRVGVEARLGEVVARKRALCGGLSWCAAAALLPGSEIDYYAAITDLVAALRPGSREQIVPVAMRILLCAPGFAAEFAERQQGVPLVAAGGTQRISLSHWRCIVDQHLDRTPEEFLHFLVEACLLSQHFATAVGRFDGTSQRLRIAIEENGLEPLVGEPWIPDLTPDRLDAAMSLMTDCRLLARADEEKDTYSIPA